MFKVCVFYELWEQQDAVNDELSCIIHTVYMIGGIPQNEGGALRGHILNNPNRNYLTCTSENSQDKEEKESHPHKNHWLRLPTERNSRIWSIHATFFSLLRCAIYKLDWNSKLASIFPYRQSPIQSKVGKCKVVVLVRKAPPVANLDGSNGVNGQLHIKLLLGSNRCKRKLRIVQLPRNETMDREKMAKISP